jgi:hypothetical protein
MEDLLEPGGDGGGVLRGGVKLEKLFRSNDILSTKIIFMNYKNIHITKIKNII